MTKEFLIRTGSELTLKEYCDRSPSGLKFQDGKVIFAGVTCTPTLSYEKMGNGLVENRLVLEVPS